MYARMLLASFRRSPRGKALALTALVLGAGTATGLSALALTVGDRMSLEMRAIGANLRVVPVEATVQSRVPGIRPDAPRAARLLREADLRLLAEPDFFWRRNVTAFTPVYRVQASLGGRPCSLSGAWFDEQIRASDGEVMATGLPKVFPAWKLSGRWPDDSPQPARSEVVLGRRLAASLGARTGSVLELNIAGRTMPVAVSGIVDAGGIENGEAYAPLAMVQQLQGTSGQAPEALVSAITTPENRIARIAEIDPRSLSPQEYDRWYCTPFPSSVARRVTETIPGASAVPIRRAAETEGKAVSRLSGIMLAAGLAAVLTACLGVLSTVWTTVLDRKREIGLLKALGAENGTILLLFLAESSLLGLLGGLLSWVFGQLLGSGLSLLLFDQPLPFTMATLPVSLAVSLLIVLAATLVPVRAALAWEPVPILHGQAA